MGGRRAADPADERLWAIVTSTVRPLPGRVAPVMSASEALAPRPASVRVEATRPPAPRPHPSRPPQAIEPRRHHRLASEREEIGGRIDLHGLDQDRARAALTDYILRSRAEGRRSILVITGKGALGNGVLRRRVPEWLAAPPLRGAVAGLSEAHRRHGGEGALYVALKRPSEPRT